MRKAAFVSILVFLLGGCSAGSGNTDSGGENNSATVEEQVGNRENDRLYVEENGSGSLIYVSDDGRTDERMWCDNGHCVLSLGLAN